MTSLRRVFSFSTLAAAAVLLLAAADHLAPSVSAGAAWNPSSAAAHMDERQAWWMNWPKAKRDHDTVCVSCHTALPYAMGRASLREMMGDRAETQQEQQMLAYVTKRVNGWVDMEPFYGEKSGPRKSAESRVAEAVLNALILARYDSLNQTMSPTTKKAFDNMWALQFTTGENRGGWEWLNFHYAPWEGDTSSYYGAALAELAVSYTPKSYKKSPGIKTNLSALNGYLQRNYEAQPLLNKVIVLWASSRMPAVLTKDKKRALIAEIEQKQQPDGGWSVATMGNWKRRDNTPIDTHEDGYATALSLLALHSSGLSKNAPQIKHGVAWLMANQEADTGKWAALSLNKDRPPASDPALFMSDAATGFAVLAIQATQ